MRNAELYLLQERLHIIVGRSSFETSIFTGYRTTNKPTMGTADFQQKFRRIFFCSPKRF
jgi:hypothetical protein